MVHETTIETVIIINTSAVMLLGLSVCIQKNLNEFRRNFLKWLAMAQEEVTRFWCDLDSFVDCGSQLSIEDYLPLSHRV